MGLDTFNKRSRPFIFRKLTEEKFDLLVIGGGITGASDLSRRRTARNESRTRRSEETSLRRRADVVPNSFTADFATSKISALASPGNRVTSAIYTSDSTSDWSARFPSSFRFIAIEGEPRWLMRLGMIAYEALSGFNNYRFHKFLSREETLSLAPALPAAGLTGGCLYYDAVINDSRWTMEVLKDGVANGGLAVNYSR